MAQLDPTVSLPVEHAAPGASAAWYALRRTLPPWQFESTLADLLAKAAEYRIDEVIVKVDTEEFSHGHPDVAWLQAYLPRLHQLRDELTSRGIVYSLNPWITVGHCDRGRDDRQRLPGLQTVVGHNGVTCRHCACPLSAVWRQRITDLWTLYAQTRPHVLWIEDDIRTFNHEPVDFGCFCPLHLTRLSELVGQPVTRQALVDAMLAPGDPHPWREAYLLMQRQVMADTVAFLARTVHAVSPDTRLGLMSSGVRRHCLEGRDWPQLAQAMADGQPLYSRPPMGNYCEGNLRGLYYSQDSIKLTRHALPAHVVEQAEIENVPFTRHSKSVRFTFLETALAFAYGVHGVTLNLFDHAGTPMADDDRFGQMLRDRKPYLEALAAAAQSPGCYRGVRLVHHRDSSLAKQLPAGAAYTDLGEDGYALSVALESAGIATTFDDGDDRAVRALIGQQPRAFDDATLRQWLADGLFLDATAAGVLVERGLGDLIGVQAIGRPRHRSAFPFILSAEAFENEAFGGAPRRYMTATLPDLSSAAHFADMTPAPNAVLVSQWVDADTQPVLPAMVVFENALGGRVAVHNLDYTTGVGIAFHHPFRREQLQGVCRWLAQGRPAVQFRCDGAYPLVWRKTTADGELLGVFNLNLDDWPDAHFELAWDGAPPQAHRLGDDGQWLDDPALTLRAAEGVLRVSYPGCTPAMAALVIRLT